VNGVFSPVLFSTSTTIVFPYPGGIPCNSQLTVTNPDLQVATTAFNPVPVVTSVVPNTGSSMGGQFVAINGTGHTYASTVTIGGAPATVMHGSEIQLLIMTPPGTPGIAPVVITTPGGCIATTTYTYL
jgi:hypothetical protein